MLLKHYLNIKLFKRIPIQFISRERFRIKFLIYLNSNKEKLTK